MPTVPPPARAPHPLDASQRLAPREPQALVTAIIGKSSEETIMTHTAMPALSTKRTLSLALMLWFSIGLFFLLVSWLVGGDRFYDSIFGHNSLAVMVVGLAAGIALHVTDANKT